MNAVYGQENPGSTGDEYNTLAFVIWQILKQVQTATLVRVISCSNNGGLSPVGTVTVQPLVNQMTGNDEPVPHGQISNVPYMRMQGGANAVILDPQPGDIGICVFCSRDISNVVATKGQANPGSYALFDWADGLYIGGFLNGAPSQYVQLNSEGIKIVSPTAITLTAPTITLNGIVWGTHVHPGQGNLMAGSTPVTGDTGGPT